MKPSLVLTSILISFILISCGRKEDKQEFLDEKPTEKKEEVKKDNNPEDNKSKDNNKEEEKKSINDTSEPVAKISPVEAADYTGKKVVVKGLVVGVYKSEKVAYLNFVEKYPKTPFTAVIFASKFEDFGSIEDFEGKTVEVTGIVSKYKEKPQIILNSKSQLKIIK